MTGPLNLADDQKSVLDAVARDILVCPCHEGAAREFSEMPESLQDEVWNDLTGEEARRKCLGLAMADESRELIEGALYALDSELRKYISAVPESAIALALNNHPDYVNNPRFRLKFLRADRFDPVLAAERIVNHFDIKSKVWGDSLLGRDIQLSDLNEDDLHSLGLGYFQVLPEPDHAGRRILFYYKALSGCYRRRENIIRAVWYLTNVISEDEAVQKLGVVNVVYNVGGFPSGGMDYEKSRLLSKIFRAIPLRFESFMVCLDDSPWLAVVEAFSMMVHKLLRVRIRTIRGSHTECLYKLMALGIPYFALPVTASCDLVCDKHTEFLKQSPSNFQTAPPSLPGPVAIIEDDMDFD